jgi:hypothetical protein
MHLTKAEEWALKWQTEARLEEYAFSVTVINGWNEFEEELV